MTDMVVANCETSAANGTYIENGTIEGKPAYYHESNPDYAIWFDLTSGKNADECWVIYDSADVAWAYVCDGDVATPDLCSDWYDIFTQDPSALTVTAAGGGAQNLTLTCAAGSYSQTGTAATLTYTGSAQNLTLSCGAGTLALTGSNATFEVKRNYVLSCSAGSYAVTGTSASLTKNLVLAVTQTTPDVVASGAGTTVVNGLYKYVNYGQYFKNDASALVFPFVYGQWYVIGINSGVYYSAIKAVDTPDLVDNWQVDTDGTAPVPTFTVSPDVGGAFYLMQGKGCTLTVQRNYTLSASAGSYSLTGTDISFGNSKSYEITCGAGAYSLTGSAVSFEVKRNYTLSCSAGSYNLTGTNATLHAQFHYSLACNSGSYLLTGTNAALAPARTLTLGEGAYALTGASAGLFRGLVLPCSAGTYALTGTDAGLNANYVFALNIGSYVMVGTAAGLFILTATPDCRTYTIPFEDREWAIPAELRTYTIPFEDRTLEVRCH